MNQNKIQTSWISMKNDIANSFIVSLDIFLSAFNGIHIKLATTKEISLILFTFFSLYIRERCKVLYELINQNLVQEVKNKGKEEEMSWIEWRRDTQVKRTSKTVYAWRSQSESEHIMRIESIYICLWLNKYFF